jgi:hypothetical protein
MAAAAGPEIWHSVPSEMRPAAAEELQVHHRGTLQFAGDNGVVHPAGKNHAGRRVRVGEHRDQTRDVVLRRRRGDKSGNHGVIRKLSVGLVRG